MSILDYFKVSAKHDQPKESKSLGGQVIHETPDERHNDVITREPLPSTVSAVLDSAINGDLRDQGTLFESMRDTMPRLQGNMDEICGLVARNDVQVEPFAEVGKDPTPSAVDKAAFVKHSLESMQVNHIMGQSDIEGTVYGIAESYYEGHSVQEILWNMDRTPKATVKLPWRYFSYPDRTDTVDRLMLNPAGEYSLNNLIDFPTNKFIVAIKKGHTGHASQAAPLRALITYWLGTVYGNKWLLGFAQIYGIPIRWATTSETDNAAKSVIGNMLKKIGSQAWAVFSSGTKLEIKEPTTSAGNLPQQALIDNANKACDIFILGQTLTSDVGSSGSQALGTVHNEIRLDVVDRVGKYCAKVISGDLVRPILVENYGDDSEMPTIKIQSKRAKDAKGLAETDEILMRTFPELERSEEQIRERHDIAKPMNEEDTIIAVTPTEEPPAEEEEEEEVKASQATIKAAENMANIDKLSNNVLESLTTVSAKWLGGVKPAFDRLAALALSDNVTDDDFLAAVVVAKDQIPELFTKLDTKTLQEAFANSSGTAMIAGVEDSLES